MPRKAAIVAGLILCASSPTASGAGPSPGATYYVSSTSGDDTGSGTSVEVPWKTLDRVEAADLGPGDRVLFRGGERFPGTLTLSGVVGTADARVVLSSYGEGRATIDAGDGSGFVLKGCEYVTLRELDFVGSGRRTNNDGYGVRIEGGAHNHVDAVDSSGFRGAGISTGGDESTRITNVRVHHNGFAGLTVRGGGDLPFTRNLYVGHSVAHDNPGDPTNTTNHSGNGIVVGGVKGGLIEYCEAFNNGWDMPRQGNGPVGIWGYFCDRLVIQHSIAHHNKTSKGGHDGGGFDLDGGATNSVLQYNLSYANQGTGYLLCQYPGAAPWKNNICRYNISVDDGRTNHFSGIYFWAGGRTSPMPSSTTTSSSTLATRWPPPTTSRAWSSGTTSSSPTTPSSSDPSTTRASRAISTWLDRTPRSRRTPSRPSRPSRSGPRPRARRPSTGASRAAWPTRGSCFPWT